jgi:hypothetical protein
MYCTFTITSAEFRLQRKMFQTLLYTKSQQILHDQHLQNRAAYGTMWKNTIEPDMSKTKKWRIRFAHSIPTATKTHSEYVAINALPWQKWLHARAPVLRYTNVAHFAICVTYLSTDSSNFFF